MPPNFKIEDHGPRQLRVTTLYSLVFGTFSDETPAIEDFVSSEVLARFNRVLGDRKVEIIGRFIEVLPNNWKMYAENARDSYHASILHLFFAIFKINRLSQGGGLVVSPNGGCSVSETIAPLVDVVDEHPDRVRHQIVTVFPNFVLQKTQNAMALRFFTPNGVNRTNWSGFILATPTTRRKCANVACGT